MLDDSQQDAAVAYNAGLALSRDEWVDIQFRIGADGDGKPGPATARAVAVYQEAHDLEADGKVGNSTKRELDAAETPWHEIDTVDLWCDLPSGWCADRADQVAGELADLGIDGLLLQLNKSGESSFRPLWSKSRLATFSAALAARGIRCGFMPWAYPSKAWIEGFGAWLPSAAGAVKRGLYKIDHDIEAPWSPSKLDGYETTYKAADDLRRVTEAGAPSATILSTSTFADAIGPSNGSRNYAVETIAPTCAGQFYAGQSNSGSSDFYNKLGPCRNVRNGLPRFLDRGVHVEAGFACYSLSYPGHSPEEAHRRHFECALWHGLRGFCGWSLKWVLPSWFSGDADNQANQRIVHAYNGAWLRELKGLRAEGCAK